MPKPTRTLTALTKQIAERTGLPQSKVKEIVSAFLDTAVEAVANDERVVLRGFGTFSKKTRKPRKYRDIRTGELKESTPGATPGFQPSKVLVQEMAPKKKAFSKDIKPARAEVKPATPKPQVAVRKVKEEGQTECPGRPMI